MLSIFEPYYQDTAMDIIWVDGIPMTKEDKDLEDTLGKELDWLEIEEVEAISNKRLRLTLENDASVDTFVTREFGLPISSDPPQQYEEVEVIDMDSTNQSAQDPQRSSALE